MGTSLPYTDGDAARWKVHVPLQYKPGLSTIATAIITISVLAVAIVSTLLTTRKKEKKGVIKVSFRKFTSLLSCLLLL